MRCWQATKKPASRGRRRQSSGQFAGGSLSAYRMLTLCLLLWVGWRPERAWGQAGVYVKPWISYGEEFDDNVFNAREERKSDIVTRFTPGIEFGYRSQPFTLLGSYDFAAEIFAKNTELTQAQARQRGGIEFEYKPTRRWTLGFSGAYTETERAQDLNLTTGISGERGRSRGYDFSPSLTHEFDPLTTARARYTFSRNERPQATTFGVSDATSDARNDEHNAELEVVRDITSRDKGSASYSFRRFRTDGAPFDEIDREVSRNSSSHIFLLGWIRQLSTLTTLSLRGGPRIGSGDVAPEVGGSLARRFQRGEVSFSYARTQNIAVGRSGALETESYLGAATYQLLPHLTLRALPAYYVNDGEDTKSKVYRLDLEASYAINQWLSLQGSYGFSYEREGGRLRGASSGGDRYRNVVFLELTASPQYRLW